MLSSSAWSVHNLHAALASRALAAGRGQDGAGKLAHRQLGGAERHPGRAQSLDCVRGAPALCLRRLPPAPCGFLRGPVVGFERGGAVSAIITASEHDQVADTRIRSLEGARGALGPCSAWAVGIVFRRCKVWVGERTCGCADLLLHGSVGFWEGEGGVSERKPWHLRMI